MADPMAGLDRPVAERRPAPVAGRRVLDGAPGGPVVGGRRVLDGGSGARVVGGVWLTALGWRLVGAAAALLAAGYLLVYPALVVLGLGGLAAVAGAGGYVASRPRPRVRREIFPDRVGRGGTAAGLLTVHNPGRRGGWLSAQDRYACAGLVRPVPVPLAYLPGSGRREVGYPLPADRRGLATVGPLRIEITDPLGLVRRRSWLGGELTLRVHPRSHPFDLRSAARSMESDGGGGSAALDGSVVFHRLREYVPGDDRRRIHWRSSARLDTLMVRQNMDVTRPDATVVLVTTRAAYGAGPDAGRDFEEAVEAAASVLRATVDAGVPARLLTTAGARVSGRGGTADLRAYLDELSTVGLTDDAGLPAVAGRLRAGRPNGMLLIATGHRYGTDELAAARRLATGYRPAVLVRLGAAPAGRSPMVPSSAGRSAGVPSAGGSLAAGSGGLAVVDAATAVEFGRGWRAAARAVLR